MEFNVGNRVKYISRRHGDSLSNPLWGGRHGKVMGTVVNDNYGGSLPYRVLWDNGHSNGYGERDLEITDLISRIEGIDELFEI